MLTGVVFGTICGYLEVTVFLDLVLWEKILFNFGMLVVLVIVIFLQIIIHEAGHLKFGKISGYTFISFRVLNCMWVKENNQLKFKRLSITGAGGQCLMSPPEMKDGKIPIILYNLGGAILYIVTGLFFLIICIWIWELSFLTAILFLLSIVGFATGLANGIPMRLNLVDNDGYNALISSKNQESIRGFWLQLRANEKLSIFSGYSIRERTDGNSK